MAKKRNSKVVRYRRPLNINVGMIIFAIIFIYLVFSISTYMRRDKIQFYEVSEGGIVNDKQYTGLILREEQVKPAVRSGYINYYLREGKRACVGARIYSLDETGSLKSLLNENQEGSGNLSDESIAELKKQLSSYVLTESDENFGAIYDARYSLENAVMEYASFGNIDQLDKLTGEAGISFKQVYSDASGVVSYAVDSYENLRPEDVEAASFNRSAYKKNTNRSGNLIEAGAPAYKIVTSEKWSILFPLNEEDASLYSDKNTLSISFRDYSLETNAAFSIITGKDGARYGKLDFTKYMEQFIKDRFVDFEVKQEQSEGLKIPVTSVTEKDFYLIPLSYLAQGGDSSDSGFYKEVYNENGTSVIFVPTEIYFADEDYYYIDTTEESGIKSGDYVVRPEASDRYQVVRTASLKGVYNINKGYTVFKQIDILDSNSEYYTVRKGTRYGLSVYDHIVLDASQVEEGQLLYQ